MEKGQRDQRVIDQMALTMPHQNLPDMQSFPYYVPDINALNNYHQMGYINNMPQINGYSNNMEVYRESPRINYQNNPENRLTPKNQNSPSPTSEKTKIKSNINYLINTVNKLLNDSKITMKYLKEKTEPRFNGINCSEYSSPSKTLGSSSKSHKASKNMNLHENSNPNDNLKKVVNNSENTKCENPLCKYIFISNNDKIKVKIKGLKIQEKNLCKKCCEAVEKGHYCYYCNAIYREGMSDSAKWVECDFCKKWEHFDCEISKGKRYSSTKELNDEKQYMCPICVNERAEKKNIDNKIQKKLINKKRRGDAFDDQKCKKNQRKDLRNLKSEKCSELLEDIQLIESIKNNI